MIEIHNRGFRLLDYNCLAQNYDVAAKRWRDGVGNSTVEVLRCADRVLEAQGWSFEQENCGSEVQLPSSEPQLIGT